MIREFSGTWPDGTEPTYYVVACGELDRAYVSMTVTTSPQDFQRNKNSIWRSSHQPSRHQVRFFDKHYPDTIPEEDRMRCGESSAIRDRVRQLQPWLKPVKEGEVCPVGSR